MWTPLSQEGVEAFGAAVGQCLQRWTALQLAVQNEWGGRSSASKLQQFHTTILDFFISARDQRYFDELEDLLDDYMLNNFNTDIDDGSVSEVTEQLLTVHEQCMLGNIDEVRKMIAETPATVQSVRNSQQLASSEDHENIEGDSQIDSRQLAGDNMEADYSTEAIKTANLSSESADTAGMSTRPNARESISPMLTEEEINEGWQTAPPRRSRRGNGR